MRARTRLASHLLLAACHPEFPETEQVRGQLVDYHYSPELTPCAGTVAGADTAARHAALLLDLEPSQLARTRYFWLSDHDLAAAVDGDSCDVGCAIGRSAFALLPMFPHEVAHTVAGQLKFPAAPFLSEGFAEAARGGPLADGDPRSYLTLDVEELGAYPGYAVANRFVSYLLEVHGTDRFGELYQRLPPAASNADWEAAIAAIYEMSLDELVAGYLATTTCTPALSPLPRFGCDAPALVADPAGNFAWTHALRCDDPEVVGGLQPADEPQMPAESPLELRRTFEITDAGEYEIATDAPQDAESIGYVTLATCDGCAWLRADESRFQGSARETVWLDPGRYAVTIVGFIEAETVGISVTRQ